MMFNCPMTRRESLKKIMQLSGGASLAGIAISAGSSPPVSHASADKKFIVEALGKSEGYSLKDLVRKTFDAAGGIGRFVPNASVVAVKPNLSWARAPQFAATTHPEVLKAVVELCQEAGAKQVRIVDHTIHDARQCFALSGAGMVAKETGADLVYPRSTLMRDMKIGGSRLDSWAVFTPVLEADALINLPIAKHHSLSTLTLGMKNWIGAVGGSRWSLHQDIHQTIVDLAQFFKPTVTLIDAVRIMTANGPSGGSAADVETKNTLILSNDPVAADGVAAMLFGRKPEEIGFIRLAQKQGLGTFDLARIDQKKVSV
jgi:uncharacterized protein (DUF362 family)